MLTAGSLFGILPLFPNPCPPLLSLPLPNSKKKKKKIPKTLK